MVQAYQQRLLRGTRSEIARAIREILSRGVSLDATELTVRLEAYDIHITKHGVSALIAARMGDIKKEQHPTSRAYTYSIWSLYECSNLVKPAHRCFLPYRLRNVHGHRQSRLLHHRLAHPNLL